MFYQEMNFPQVTFLLIPNHAFIQMPHQSFLLQFLLCWLTICLDLPYIIRSWLLSYLNLSLMKWACPQFWLSFSLFWEQYCWGYWLSSHLFQTACQYLLKLMGSYFLQWLSSNDRALCGRNRLHWQALFKYFHIVVFPTRCKLDMLS